MNSPALTAIKNYRRIDDSVATAGQPTAEQFPAIKAAGFETIVNLALADSPGAIDNEDALVRQLGLEYVHIPVEFKAPTPDRLRQFFEVMDTRKDKRVFVHCAYNFRVSAFVYLYRVIKGHCPAAEALTDMQAVWTPDDTWQAFIDQVLAVYDNDTERKP